MLPDHRAAFFVGRAALTASCLLLLSLFPATTSLAQDTDLEALIHRLDRLDLDISGIQRRLASEIDATTDDRSMQTEQTILSVPTQQETRLNELEEQLRTLTGEIEQTQHSLDQAMDRMSSLSEDVMSRFEAIDGDLSSLREQSVQALSPGVPAVGPTVSNGSETADGAIRSIAIDRDPNVEEYDTMGVLGEISSDADVGTEQSEVAAAVMPSVDQQAVASLGPEESYDEAYQLLRRADYSQAEQALRLFIETYPDHQLSGNAFYWLGETFYVRNDYEQAAKSFAHGYKSFPSGPKAPDNLLKLGISLRGMEKNADACHTFARLKLDHSNAPAVILTRLEQERAKAGCQ